MMIEINYSLLENDDYVKPLLPHLNPIPDPEPVPNPIPTPNPKIEKRATPEDYNKLIEIIIKVNQMLQIIFFNNINFI